MHMQRKMVGHVILTSEDVTYFFKIERQLICILDGIDWNSRDPPWLGAIDYIVHAANNITGIKFNNFGSTQKPQPDEESESIYYLQKTQLHNNMSLVMSILAVTYKRVVVS